MSRFDIDPATYKGEEIDGFTVNGMYYEHRIFTRTDDRIDCFNEEGNLVLRYNSSCGIFTSDGKDYGRLSMDWRNAANPNAWVAYVDGQPDLKHYDNLKLEILVSERYVKEVWEKNPLTSSNHYHYLDAIVGEFWKLVFGKTLSEMYCAGIVSSHGDKCEQYKSRWKEAGVSYKHGALLYLLTYTNELGNTPKHKSCEWVIENYPKYKDKIIQAENIFKKVQQAQSSNPNTVVGFGEVEVINQTKLSNQDFQQQVVFKAIQRQLDAAKKTNNGRVEFPEELVPLTAVGTEVIETYYSGAKNLRYIFKDGKEVSIIKKKNFFRDNLKNKYRIEISVVQDGNLVEEHHFYPEREKEALKAFYHVLHGIPEQESELKADYRFDMETFYPVE